MELFESMTVRARCWQHVYVCAVCVWYVYVCICTHIGVFFLIWGGEGTAYKICQKSWLPS